VEPGCQAVPVSAFGRGVALGAGVVVGAVVATTAAAVAFVVIAEHERLRMIREWGR
jgi:hypothetical protein